MQRLRLTLFLTAVAGALAAAAPAGASSPYWTQKPELFVQGTRLFVSNGGWSSNSGTPTKVLFRFLRDGVVVKGLRNVPQATQPNQLLPSVAPDDPGAQYYSLSAADAGRCFVAEAWGGIRSTYRAADGTLVYDVWEWGHLNSFGVRAVTNQVCIGGDGLPAAPSSPPPLDSPLPVLPRVLTAPVGSAYSQRLSVAGAGTGFTYRAAADSLPAGVALSADGVVSGTPTGRPGDYAFGVVVTSASGVTGTVELVFTVQPPQMAFASRPLSAAKRGRPYRARIVVTGGEAPYAFRMVGGRLAPGLRLLPNGVITGRPTRAARYRFTIEARDATGATVRRAYALLVRRR